MEVKFTLGHTLKELDITINKLAVESKIRPGTIRDMVNGSSKSISLGNIVSILSVLNQISIEKERPKKYAVEDIFIVE